MDEGTLELEIRSLRELCERKLGEVLLYWETTKDMPSETLEIGVCFHRGPAFGVHEGTLLSKIL
jgi:hypothetical protein